MTDKHRSAGEMVVRVVLLPDKTQSEQACLEVIAALEQKLAKYEAAEKSLPPEPEYSGDFNECNAQIDAHLKELRTLATAALSDRAAMAAEVRRATIEECAKVCDELFAGREWGCHPMNVRGSALRCATAIRALAAMKAGEQDQTNGRKT